MPNTRDWYDINKLNSELVAIREGRLRQFGEIIAIPVSNNGLVTGGQFGQDGSYTLGTPANGLMIVPKFWVPGQSFIPASSQGVSQVNQSNTSAAIAVRINDEHAPWLRWSINAAGSTDFNQFSGTTFKIWVSVISNSNGNFIYLMPITAMSIGGAMGNSGAAGGGGSYTQQV